MNPEDPEATGKNMLRMLLKAEHGYTEAAAQDAVNTDYMELLRTVPKAYAMPFGQIARLIVAYRQGRAGWPVQKDTGK